MLEIWRDIDGYNGKYQVSNLGNVKSIYTIYVINGIHNKYYRDIILQPFAQKNGYLNVCLWKDGKKKNRLIHQLVAQSFIPNPNNLPQVNHKDEDKTNNVVSNLEWCTAKENVNYGTCIQRMSESQINNSKRSKVVYQYSMDNIFIKEWPSAREIERQLGYIATDICACCRGIRKTAYGYIWKRKMEET